MGHRAIGNYFAVIASMSTFPRASVNSLNKLTLITDRLSVVMRN